MRDTSEVFFFLCVIRVQVTFATNSKGKKNRFQKVILYMYRGATELNILLTKTLVCHCYLQSLNGYHSKMI